MRRRLYVLPLWLALACTVVTNEAIGATIQAHSRLQTRRGDGDGDDGAMSGLGGALAGMFGGGGGGDDGEGGDDDDPNMVGGKKKAKAGKGSAGSGIDTGALEKGLASGGVNQLTAMLSAMRAAQGNADTHIKKGANGEDMYDFRDLDDGFTTPKPITMAPTAMPTLVPMNQVSIPQAPTIALPGKHGKLRGVQRAEAQVAKYQKDAGTASPPQRLVVWPPAAPAQGATPAIAAPMAPFAAAPIATMLPAPLAAPLAAPLGVPMASSPSLYQGLEMMRQNMDMLMGKVASMGGAPAANVNDAPLAAKLDQLSQNVASEEKKLEGKVDALEGENSEMKKELQEQAEEIKGLTGGQITGRATSKARKTKALLKTSAKMKPGYATEPWEATFSVHLDGKAGGKKDSFKIRVHPEWAPHGAKRFQDMVRQGLLQNDRFFRVVPHFMVQFGLPASPKVTAKWLHKKIPDDPVKKSNYRGTLSFAAAGPNTRTMQVFVNYANNEFLDRQGFAPFAEVIEDGMNVVDKIQGKYQEKPQQGKIMHHGNKYLMKSFPDLSFIDHVDSSLSAPVPALIQDSEAPVKVEEPDSRAFRYGGIRTFFHHKRIMGD